MLRQAERKGPAILGDLSVLASSSQPSRLKTSTICQQGIYTFGQCIQSRTVTEIYYEQDQSNTTFQYERTTQATHPQASKPRFQPRFLEGLTQHHTSETLALIIKRRRRSASAPTNKLTKTDPSQSTLAQDLIPFKSLSFSHIRQADIAHVIRTPRYIISARARDLTPRSLAGLVTD